jgi:hypothetical protein
MAEMEYYRSDERPEWVATITANGVTDDMSAGYTFQVLIAPTAVEAPVLTKATGITGGPDGVVTVQWEPSDLDLEPRKYIVQLTATRTSDSAELTVQDEIRIKPRLAA